MKIDLLRLALPVEKKAMLPRDVNLEERYKHISFYSLFFLHFSVSLYFFLNFEKKSEEE